jgi:uncharacterized protein
MTPELWLLAAGAAIAGFVQGVSGFGFSMVALTIWAWGLEPRLAAVAAVTGAFSGQVLTALTSRRGWHWATLWPLLAGAALGVPLGVWILPQLDAQLFKLLLGVVLLVFCPAMLFAERWPQWHAGGRWGDAAAGAAGGVMGALGGVTGVVPALWGTLRGYDKDLHRAVIQNFNLATLGATLLAFVSTGAVKAHMLPALVVVIPTLLLPAWLGGRLYKGMSPVAFRRVVLWSLTASGALLIGAYWTARAAT